MKKCIAWILAVCLLCFSFGGCGQSSPASIIGTWENTVDISEYLTYKMGDSVFAGYIQLKDIPMYLHYTFTEDGSFTVKVNEQKTQKSWDKFLDEIIKGVEKAFVASFPDRSVKDFFDSYEKENGVSMRQTLAEKNKMSDLLTSFENNGYYVVQGNRLYRFAEKEKTEITDDTVYELFSLKGKTLTILSSTDPKLTAEEKAKYPYEFQWVK